MKSKINNIVIGAMICALYVVLTITQSIIFPGSTTQAIQFRASEALMMLALFSPTAVVGLTIGCVISNMFIGMPIDILWGSMATLLAGWCIYKSRKIELNGFPYLSLIFPALCNGIIVGLEIQLFFIGEFNLLSYFIQAGCVACGEFAVSVFLGIPLYYGIKKAKIHQHLK